MKQGYLISLGMFIVYGTMFCMDDLSRPRVPVFTGIPSQAMVTLEHQVTSQPHLSIELQQRMQSEIQQRKAVEALQKMQSALRVERTSTAPRAAERIFVQEDTFIELPQRCAEGLARQAAAGATVDSFQIAGQFNMQQPKIIETPQERTNRIIDEQQMAVCEKTAALLQAMELAPGTYTAIITQDTLYVSKESVDRKIVEPLTMSKNYQLSVACKNGAKINLTGGIAENGTHICTMRIEKGIGAPGFRAYAHEENTIIGDVITGEGLYRTEFVVLPLHEQPSIQQSTPGAKAGLALPKVRLFPARMKPIVDPMITQLETLPRPIQRTVILHDQRSAMEPSLQPVELDALRSRFVASLQDKTTAPSGLTVELPGPLGIFGFALKTWWYIQDVRKKQPALTKGIKEVLGEQRTLRGIKVNVSPLQATSHKALSAIEQTIYGKAKEISIPIRSWKPYEKQLERLLTKHGICYKNLVEGLAEALAKGNEIAPITAKNLYQMPTEFVDELLGNLKKAEAIAVRQHLTNLEAVQGLIKKLALLRDNMVWTVDHPWRAACYTGLDTTMPEIYREIRDGIAAKLEQSSIERLNIELYVQARHICAQIIENRAQAEMSSSLADLGLLRSHLVEELKKYEQMIALKPASLDALKTHLQNHIDHITATMVCKQGNLADLKAIATRLGKALLDNDAKLRELSKGEPELRANWEKTCKAFDESFAIPGGIFSQFEAAYLQAQADRVEAQARRWELEGLRDSQLADLAHVNEGIRILQGCIDRAAGVIQPAVEQISPAAHIELMKQGSQQYHARGVQEPATHEEYIKILSERIAELQAVQGTSTREQNAELYYVTYELTQTTWDTRAAEYAAFVAAEVQQGASEFSKERIIAAQSALKSHGSLCTTRVIRTPEVQKACALHGINLEREQVFFGDAVACQLYRESAIMMERGVSMEAIGMQCGNEKLAQHGGATRSWASLAEASARKHLGQAALLCNKTAEVSWKLGRAVALGTVDGIIEAGSTCLLHPQRLATGITDGLVGGYKLIGCILDRACTAECALEVFQQNPERGAAFFAEIDRYREENPDMLAQLHKTLGSYQTNTPWDQQIHDFVKELTRGYFEGRVLCALGGLARHTTNLTAEHITTAAAAAISKVSPKVQTALAAAGADAQKLAQEVAGIESGLCKQVGVTPGKIRNPDQVAQKIGRFIQTPRLKIANLEKYFAQKLAITKTAIFEKANLKHLFGIEKIQKIRAAGKIEAIYAGFHHDKGWSLVKKGKVKFLTEPVVCPKTDMVTVGKVAIEGVVLKNPKTFFPPSWNRSKVIDKIFEASQNVIKKELDGTRSIIIGQTAEGMNIQMVIDESRKLITAYPVSI